MRSFLGRVLLAAVCAAFGAHAVFLLYGRPAIGVDDANIFFVYARNLVDGHGLSYNAGSERVEGFTSMLWTLVCAAAFAVSRHPEMLLLAVGVGLVAVANAACLTVLRQTDRCRYRLLGISPFEWAFLILVFASPAYVTWTTITLMDTALWGSLLAVAAALCLVAPMSGGWQWTLGAVLALMVFARPEALAVVPGLAGVLFLRLRAEEGTRRAWRVALRLGTGLAMVVAGLTCFRLLYFGYPLPNTYYAKVSPSIAYNLGQGMGYLHRYAADCPIAAVAFLAALVVVAGRLSVQMRIAARGQLRQAFSLAAAPEELTALIGLMLLLIPVLTGGDHFALFRFYQPAYPLLCLLLVLLARRCALAVAPAASAVRPDERWWTSIPWLVALLPLLWWCKAFAATPTWAEMRGDPPLWHEFHIAERGAAVSQSLETLFVNWQPKPTVGVIAAGGIKRVYSGPVLDLMGLNSTVFGHGKGERRGMKNHAAFELDVFYRNCPEILRAQPAVPPETDSPDNRILKGLLTQPRFIEQYSFVELASATNREIGVRAFFRKDFVKELLKSGRYCIVGADAP